MLCCVVLCCVIFAGGGIWHCELVLAEWCLQHLLQEYHQDHQEQEQEHQEQEYHQQEEEEEQEGGALQVIELGCGVAPAAGETVAVAVNDSDTHI
jgi:hypothetical protein